MTKQLKGYLSPLACCFWVALPARMFTSTAQSTTTLSCVTNDGNDMRIEAYLRESPMFMVKGAARHFDAMAAEAFAADELGFIEGLVLAATFLEDPKPTQPSQLAQTFGTTRGNVSHVISSLEAKGLLQRKIDPLDARGYLLTLKPSGRRCAIRVVGAFDRMQRGFEKQVGKDNLDKALKVIRALQTDRGI